MMLPRNLHFPVAICAWLDEANRVVAINNVNNLNLTAFKELNGMASCSQECVIIVLNLRNNCNRLQFIF